MIQDEAGCMKQLKMWMFLICFALGLNSSEGKKCCVSRAYAVCAGWPQIFWEDALIAEKKTNITPMHENQSIFLFIFNLLTLHRGREVSEKI